MIKKVPSRLGRLLEATTPADVSGILDELQVVQPEDFAWKGAGPVGPWREGHLHWWPIGGDAGNAGRIDLAGEPMNPIAERIINGMEAQIELARHLELARDPEATPPANAREAALRYFGVPRLDEIEALGTEAAREARSRADAIRDNLQVRYHHSPGTKPHSVTIRDRGIGQSAATMHSTVLSLGRSSKGDKNYLIGLFGQGGSSTFSASEYSIVVSRRASIGGVESRGDPVGWSIVRCVHLKGRRDKYYAYLAAKSDGSVPDVAAAEADAVGFDQGTYFGHFGYDFGGTKSAVSRTLYQSLNHVLFAPVLPYALYVMKSTAEPMMGTGQRLSRKVRKLGEDADALDKTYVSVAIP